MKTETKDALHRQFWQSVSPAERANWPSVTLDEIYAWFLANAPYVTKDEIVDIEVRDDMTIVSVLSIDCPFIIDSVTALVQRMGFTIFGLVHPVMTDESFRQDLSLVSLRIQESLSTGEVAALRKALSDVMQDVMLATHDWRAMRATMKDVLADLEKNKQGSEEEHAFLRYLDNNFTFLGYAKTDTKKLHLTDGLGILSQDRSQPLLGAQMPLPTSQEKTETGALVIFKLSQISNVHRPVRLDCVVVRSGKAEYIFVGLFTSVTYSRSIKDVPLLREKAQKVVDASGFESDHHDYKALVHILEKYPRDELFRIDLPTLTSFAHGIMRLQERQRIALFARPDHLTHTISALVYVPRERYDTRLRKQIQEILAKAFNAEEEGHTVSLDDSPLVRVLFAFRVPPQQKVFADTSDIEKTLLEQTRSWSDRLRSVLPRADVALYENVFPVVYQTKLGISTLKTDVAKLNALLQTGQMQLELYRPDDMGTNRLRFKVYLLGDPVPLSDVLPILENLGLRVLSEQPYELSFADGTSAWMHDFKLAAEKEDTSYDIERLRPIFEEAFQAIWHQATENDVLNRLIPRAEMNVRQVSILRAYARYLHQIRISYSPSYVLTTLGDYPCLSRKIVRLFEAMFAPDHPTRGAEIEELLGAIEKDLAKVPSLDQDTIFRRLLNLVTSTLRTNAYQPDEKGQQKSYLSFKMDCIAVTDMPEPRPKYEIFVSSARMEGVHLRSSDVSRGGLRWSDRPDDFRTEILGLMKAQTVKNAVIVPTGAKGGFVLKCPPKNNDRAALQAEGIACYKILIRGLLDITDNIEGGQITHPDHVVRYDGPDPYLVVAADKGTATFSDIANGLSQEYGFWLDDAFASGGSAGYDHKVMGITAKGAWECVKRHFRETGKNIQIQPFTCVGVGDMSGDVFGNGMLLSTQTKLLGAFNHMHIFCDPDPNPAKSFAERKRLFNEVKGWGEYNKALLSKGGQIYLRSEKTLKLTKEIKDTFNLDQDEVAPAELIRAMLCAPVELLYFGGIGTYVKDENETHAEVSDKANDALRVNAQEMRALVIGEGANLALTQRSRITLGRQGVRLNTDFIDNSAGVDCSDHEVNIKILLTSVMRDPKAGLDRAGRDSLLASMTESVSELVLRDNYQQSLALSLAQSAGPEMLNAHSLALDILEASYGLNRKIETLPGARELEERRQSRLGLTRPELAVLLSYAKLALTRDIVTSDIPDQPYAAVWLETYFPEVLRQRYPDAIQNHRLRREIIATQIANSVINRMGPHFIFTKQEQTGLSVASIVDAYVMGRDVLNLHPIWRGIEALDNQVDVATQMRMFVKSSRALDRLVRRLLNLFGERLRDSQEFSVLKKRLQSIMPHMIDLLSLDLREQYEQRVNELHAQKAPQNMAEAVSLLPYAVMAYDALQLAGNGADTDETVRAFFTVGMRFRIDSIRQQSRVLAAEKPQDAMAISGLIDSLATAQVGLTRQVLAEPGEDIDGKLTEWVIHHVESVNVIDRLLFTLLETGPFDLARLVMIEQKIRQLASRKA